ncbi:hypothetical protein B0T18DRAFT_153328 [Schizothecium vesticola]|uniref:Uncharacterized protein n=1 Tax=Schizothecium vesticola TaxID=314040 RepID=A0AA40EW84_9PEZI|nr:hypothetical protein B0T18DRAFT_153328 [Schizothecium vesticola]
MMRYLVPRAVVLHHHMRRHVLHRLLDIPQHPHVDAKRTPHRPVRLRHGRLARDGSQRQLGTPATAAAGVLLLWLLLLLGRRREEARPRAAARRRCRRAEAGVPRRRRQRGGRVGLPSDGAERGKAALGAVAVLARGRGLCLGVGFGFLHLAEGGLEDELGVGGVVHGGVAVAGGGGRGGVGLQLLRGVWGGRGVLEAADDLVAGAGADGEGGVDAEDALDGVADGGGGDVGRDAHEAGEGVDEVGDVVGRVARDVGREAALAADEQAVALLEAVDPAGRELGRRLILVARQGREDGLGLVGELFVGGLAAVVEHALVPHEHELLDVGPVAEAQARARQLRVAVEARVLERQRVRDGRLRDGLAVLALEPFDAGLVAGADRLRVGPAPQRAALVQRERVALLGPGRRVLELGLGRRREVGHGRGRIRDRGIGARDPSRCVAGGATGLGDMPLSGSCDGCCCRWR